jgi:hypothetical protein
MKHLLPPLLFAALTTACATGPSKGELDDEVRRLCAIDGGVKVYETVVLPPEKFDKYGNVNLREKKYLTARDEYYSESETLALVSGNPRLLLNKFRVIRRADGEVMAEAIMYGRGGGDLAGPHPSSFTCPSIAESVGKLESSVFHKGATE